MAAAALILYGISLTVAFGVRVALQLRRTGSTGLHGLPPGAGPWEWVLGLVLIVPSVLALAAILTLFVGLELQVRLIEEPYLWRVHGDTYAAYASRAGRFVPRLGLLHGARLVAIAALSAAFASALFVPPPAAALDSDLKGFAVFKLEASHGYSILGFASSERIDGRGDIGLIVYRGGSAVSYSAPAIVTPTRLEADLGALGEIAADIALSDRKKKLRSRCGGGVRTIQPDLYRGRFEFHGEEGYADAVATRVTEDAQFLLDLTCARAVGGESFGAGLPGARLRSSYRHGDRRLSLQLNKNRPGKATVFSATLAEKRGEIRIERSVFGRQPARAFEYDPLLRTATVEPPAPFSGVARFHGSAAPANRWTGNLSLDFPGESNVRLTGAGFTLNVAHARRMG